MEMELTFTMVVTGEAPVEFHYKGEDGKDDSFCQWMQDGRCKLSHKMKDAIDKVFK